MKTLEQIQDEIDESLLELQMAVANRVTMEKPRLQELESNPLKLVEYYEKMSILNK